MGMAFLPPFKSSKPRRRAQRKDAGIALFMVMSCVSVLAILVGEFTYIAQVSQQIAFGSLDQIKAHYLAKSGLKISLLRLKAYQQVKNFAQASGAGAAVPKGMLEKIWSFPFIYPIPLSLPGITPLVKDSIKKFQDDTNFEGTFTARIESDSAKYNLNMLLENYAPLPSSSPSAANNPSNNNNPNTPPSPGTAQNNPPGGNPNVAPTFDPQAARDSLTTYLDALLAQKYETDPDFADAHRDIPVPDLVDAISGWVDPKYQSRAYADPEAPPPKRGPFYSLEELHMIPKMDDELYQLLASSLSASTSNAINVNTMGETTLRALLPGINTVEAQEFFKFRDDPNEDNQFKSSDDFFKWIGAEVAAYRNPQAIAQVQTQLTQRNIRLVTDETNFKITVDAKVNNASRLIEAWVTLKDPQKQGPQGSQGPQGQLPQQGQQLQQGQQTPDGGPDVGLKITYMRIT